MFFQYYGGSVSEEIVFDGDKTLNELVDELMEYAGEDDEVSSICQLEGEHKGFELLVTIRKNETLHA